VEENELNFRLGKRFGSLLSEISREHIIAKKDPMSAYKVFSESGAPPECALDLLSGNKVIEVSENGIDCYVVDYDSLSSESKELYPEPISWGEWADNIIEKNLKIGYGLLGIMKEELYQKNINDKITLLISEDEFKSIFEVPSYIDAGYDWRGYCSLTLVDIINYWYKKKSTEDLVNSTIKEGSGIEIIEKIKFLDDFLDESTKIISCVSWLYDQYGFGDKNKLNIFQKLVYDGSLILILLSDYKNNKERIDIILGSYTIKEESLDDLKEMQKNLEVESSSDELAPVDITGGWDAGYISPDGVVYAARGEICQFLHLQLADKIYETYGFYKYKPSSNKDWELDRMGWVKFHSGKVLFCGYSVFPPIPLTTAQKEELKKYADSCGGFIRCGLKEHQVSSDDIINQPENYYIKLFDN